MNRRTHEILEFCGQKNRCVDCFLQERDIAAEAWVSRGNDQIPYCQEHFKAWQKRKRESDRRKQETLRAERIKKHHCVRCGNKLISPELLPEWARHGLTCGMHVKFSSVRANGQSILKRIIDSCLTAEEKRNMIPQHIVYKPGQNLVFFGYRQGRAYSTIVFTVKGLDIPEVDFKRKPKAIKTPLALTFKFSLLTNH